MKLALRVAVILACAVCARAATEPVLYTVGIAEQEGAPGLIDEGLWVDYAMPSDVEVVPSWRTTNRTEVIWADDQQGAIAWMSETSVYGPYLNMDVTTLERYAERRVHAVHALTVLGVRLYQSNELARSVSCFQKALSLDPENERAAELYSAIIVRAGDLAAAQDASRQQLDRFPGNATIRFNLVCALALDGQFESALQHVLFLARHAWPELLYHMADPDIAGLRADSRFLELEKQLLEQQRTKTLEAFQRGLLRPNL